VARLAPAGLRGRLDAAFSPSHDGARAAVAATSPLELRGPLRGDAAALFYLRNVTAGVLDGDCYEVRLRTEPGVRVQVASSSATKVFTMPVGGASSHVDLHAAPGSVIVWGPHATILQAGAAYRQSTRIHVAPGAIVLAAEVIAFGRLARGERHAFHRFDSELIVHRDACPVFEERYSLTPTPLSASGEGLGEGSLAPALAGRGVLASVYALGVDAALLPCLDPVIDAPLAGAGALPNDAGLVARLLCDSLSTGTAFVESCLRHLLTEI